jgi:N6-adenosine-specific RNA methylase IME4
LKDAVLLLWTTDMHLREAFEVIDAWGFKYKTVGFYWVKTERKSHGFAEGLGYWTRSNPEICLLATKGHPKRKSKSEPKLVVSPLREHSRKPDEIREAITRLTYGPYLELFARATFPEWQTWGNETDKFTPDKLPRLWKGG